MSVITRRQAILGAAQLGLLSVVSVRALAQDTAPIEARVTLVLVNDLYRMADKDGRGGHAKLATVAKQERAKGNALVIHAGDAYSPSLLSGIDKGHHIVDLLNHIKPDVFTPGNHEFDFGPQIFRERLKQSEFDVVAANIREQDGAIVAGLKPTKMIEIGGFKLGFVGVCLEQTAELSSPGDIHFAPAVATVREVAQELRSQGADIVVAVTHTAFDQDMEMVRSGAADVILSGHDHDMITFYDGKVLLVESGSDADFVTPVDLLLKKAVKDGKTQVSFVPNVRAVDTLNVEPDPELTAIIKRYQSELDRELDVPIGTAGTAFTTQRSELRGQENAFGNLVCDAMIAATGADICLINSGGIRGNRDYEADSVLTRKHIFEALPFGNKTVVVEVTGKILRAALENGLGDDGGWPQIGGMVINADMNKPAGKRLQSVAVAGKPLDDAGRYKLATNDYLLAGGNGYAMLKDGNVLLDQLGGQYVAGQVIGFIQTHGKVSPKTEGRLVIER